MPAGSDTAKATGTHLFDPSGGAVSSNWISKTGSVVGILGGWQADHDEHKWHSPEQAATHMCSM